LRVSSALPPNCVFESGRAKNGAPAQRERYSAKAHMRHNGVTATLVCTILTGCAAQISHKGEPGASLYLGKVVGVSTAAAEPNWAINESYTAGMFGAVGVALAHATGTPKKTFYAIRTSSGALYSVTAQSGFYTGDCVQFWVPRTAQAEAERSRDKTTPAIQTEPLGAVELERTQPCE